MIAFDTDVLSLILGGNATMLTRLGTVAPGDRCVPVVAAAEVMRGWLAAIRQAESGRSRVSLELAYDKFAASLAELRGFHILPYTRAADSLVASWKSSKFRVGPNDMRIAAIAIVHGVKLVTRNARDYARVPGLVFDVWN